MLNVIRAPVRVRLEMDSRAEHVALTRAALAGLARTSKLGTELIADLKTAVSEACNNVVLHAYPDGPGLLVVDLYSSHAEIAVRVSDRGKGLTAAADRGDHLGMGLAIISALAARSEFAGRDGGGTTVKMWFDAGTTAGGQSGASSDGILVVGDEDLHLVRARAAAGDVIIWASCAQVFGDVVDPMLRLRAAYAGFSASRLAELHRVSAAITAYTTAAAIRGVVMALSSSTRRVDLVSGPFQIASGPTDADLRRQPAVKLRNRRQELSTVVDEFRTEHVSNAEMMIHLAVTDPGKPGLSAR